ncbi:MAG: hypothetical protein MK135_04810, partial [Polyangiaceae bacterium]|nr:hypothetical protein [Polyangiaceae bacterium]
AHTCILSSENTPKELFCWGSNWQGQIGKPGAVFDDYGPEKVSGVTLHPDLPEDHSLVSAGGVTCAIDPNRAVVCFGDDIYRQLGRGDDTTPPHEPAPVAGLPGPTIRLFGGNEHFCALLGAPFEGDLYCWGRHQATGTFDYLAPEAEFLMGDTVHAALHTEASFAVLNNGAAKSWGAADSILLSRSPYPRLEPRACCDDF